MRFEALFAHCLNNLLLTVCRYLITSRPRSYDVIIVYQAVCRYIKLCSHFFYSSSGTLVRILARLAAMPEAAPRSYVVRCPPLPDDAFGPPADRLQRAASSTDQQRDINARYVEESGMCQVCSMHCMPFTKPAPTRLLELTPGGRRACALCYQFERTRCAARKIRRESNTYYLVMRELRKLEALCSSMVTGNPSMLQPVVPTQTRSTGSALWGEREHVQEQDIWQRSQSWSSVVTHAPSLNLAPSQELNIWQRSQAEWGSSIWGPACDVPSTFFSNEAAKEPQQVFCPPSNASVSPTSSPDQFTRQEDFDPSASRGRSQGHLAAIREERDPSASRWRSDGRGRGRDGRRQGQVNKKLSRWPIHEFVGQPRPPPGAFRTAQASSEQLTWPDPPEFLMED